jgi:hypothetical protein
LADMPFIAIGLPLMGVQLVVSVSIVGAENRPQVRPLDGASGIRLSNSTHVLVASSRDLGLVDPKLHLEQVLLILGPAWTTTQLALPPFNRNRVPKLCKGLQQSIRRGVLTHKQVLP